MRTIIPKISILIPCFNCEQTLRQAVASCYLQGFPVEEFEIVLVNDDSTDNTKQIIKKLLEEKDNIRAFVNEENKGGGATRNIASSHAESEVFFYLDSDDVLPEHTLHTMYTYLQSKKCDGVGLHHSTKFKGADVSDIDHVNTFSYVDQQIPFESLFQKNDILCPLYSVFMCTRAAFEISGGFPTVHGFDTQGFAWRFLGKGLTAYTCPNTNYFHRIDFSESYYLREYHQGKVNFNWQHIFTEHLHLFSAPAQFFIQNFNSRDFTKNIFAELLAIDPLLTANYRDLLLNPPETLETNVPLQTNSNPPSSRNSLLGLFYRLRARMRLILE
ncbi:glycosyltransferase [Flavobacteriaceae bacterium]|nr:glycosyltransferase [Flavobacteriaceae bacterium]